MLRDGRAVRVLVTVGQSDGRHTEITGGALADGDQVITKLASGGQS